MTGRGTNGSATALVKDHVVQVHIFRAVSKRIFRNAEEQGTRRGVRSEKQKGHDCILGLFRKGTAVSLRRRAIKI